MRQALKLFVLGSLLAGCTPSGASWYRPGVDTRWQWQLQGSVDTGYDVELYDIDLFDTDPDLIERFHDRNRKVVCYFSAGSFEGWRSDANDFAASDLGSPLEGFEDERWLDIRSQTVREVMLGRLELARDKGCDGVEPDNVDGYANDTGFPLTGDDQLGFNRFLANEAHRLGLAVGLKNDLEQIPELVAYFDFSVNEQCHEYDECEALLPFVQAGKPVFNAEYLDAYRSDPDEVCTAARSLDIRTLILPLELDDSFRVSCD